MNPERLRVVLLSRAVAPWHGVGGLERHVADMTRHLVRRGVRVTLVTPPPTPQVQGRADDGATLPGLEDARADGRFETQFVPYVTFPFAGRRGTTILDRNTAYPYFGRRAGRLAYRLVEGGGVQIVHGHGASTLGYAAARMRDPIGTVPFIFNPHGLEEFGGTDPSRAWLKTLAYRPLRTAVRTCSDAADRVIATDEVLAPVVRTHLAVREDRLRVIPNAVDLDAIDTLAAAGNASADDPGIGACGNGRVPRDGGSVPLLAVGRLEANKGFHVLIEALSRLSAEPRATAWRLVLVGDGPRRGALEKQAQEADLGDQIRFVGRLADEAVHGWYAAATLFVHPTLYEGSSLVTLEAMAHRCAVVASAAGGIPDKVQQGVTGWLVPPGDAGALARAIAGALSNPARLLAMGEAGRALVERKFSWPAVTERLLDLYAETLAGSQRAQPTGSPASRPAQR
ncbi:MAG: glycosyltransferase family 4 protein [Acidobacteria bacterium]|nr:glycosyltransferase family 4 protein [Acidobacteriota bacterium]MYJ06003.1 glycosyltransferase family 4 protein [Acidobacteriota bacterium]